ncbi:16S rRNA (cytosine(1402)-N(4))-methyltransferase RsmH [Christensenella sp. MSJ-20]|uniref:16S rRNA (cytosine(1402)-N(4))-methyltransferase RsmH n=1 Tax=Christensenella sp. MSJ-20 TaxID=2841518 RepID=UPI001C7925DD|nr:16S rRNA (cytosine(1402)-N(4))-methyltransferase RsmH [Christensenella sp. MSJ-20]
MGAFTHIPVMARECMDLLFQGPGKTMVDGTLGLGGHSGMILSRLPEDGRLIGIDQDLNAIAMAGERLPKDDRITLVHESFFHIPRVLDSLGVDHVDGILLDLGVSSYQLDDPTRGFSYMADGPLDMRMDSTQKISAWDVVNGYSEKELDRVIHTYGEERWSRRIAQFIVERRPIDTSFQLVEAIKAAIPKGARRDGPHPAKRTFQAIRIEVNGELSGLPDAIRDGAQRLGEGGVLCVITFHSLEDRIVKQGFQSLARACTCPPEAIRCTCDRIQRFEILTKKPLVPHADELEENPRSRSAKVRALRRIRF